MLCLTVMLLTSCETTGQGDFCEIYRPVYIGTEDVLTDPTARMILANNQKWQEECDG
jgi:hypothetical protein